MTPIYIAIHVEKFTDLRKMQNSRKNLMYRHCWQIYFVAENVKRYMMSSLIKTVRWQIKANGKLYGVRCALIRILNF